MGQSRRRDCRLHPSSCRRHDVPFRPLATMGDHPARSWLVSRSQKHILAQRWHTLAPLISLFLVLLLVPGTHQTSALGERTFHSLSEDDISMLVSTPDPTKSVDLSDSNSHLSKILIPRSRRLDLLASMMKC